MAPRPSSRSLSAPQRPLSLGLALAGALALGACAGGARARPLPAGPDPTAAAPIGEFSVDRGDWLVGNETGVWIVEVPGDPTQSKAPERLGYVVARAHRQVRGGPQFTVYEVTGLDRHNPIGIVDSLGNAKRFHPRRGGGIEVEDKGNSSLVNSVQSIFDTRRPVSLVPTTEVKLSFEVLDSNHDGLLDKDEFPSIGTKYGNPDKNRDGKIDLGEFEQADVY